tara:strand:+ start:873 stop:2282 length:1410 start_codon:yes stop_codon:yes gene_type:complete
MKNVILSIGWSQDLIHEIIEKVEKLNKSNIKFFHLVEVRKDIKRLNLKNRNKLDLVKVPKNLEVSDDDLRFLQKLETNGVPTIRSMIIGDPYLRYIKTKEALGYAAFIGRAILKIIKKRKPLIVLASNDKLISSIALAVARYTNTQFVAMAFTVIPNNRTWFIERMTPNSLIPINIKEKDKITHSEVKSILDNFYKNKFHVQSYSAPNSIKSFILDVIYFFWQKCKRSIILNENKPIKYVTLSYFQAFANRLIRLVNRLTLISFNMIKSPPREKFAYYPIAMSPESMIDTWAIFYQDQIALLKQIALALPLDTKLVVKLHFSDPDSYSRKQLSSLSKISGVLIADPLSNSRKFLENSSLVFGITGTSCLEASLLGKPTIIFGDTPYLKFPNSERAKKPDELYTQIKTLMKKQSPTKKDIEHAFKKFANRYMPGRINDWTYPITRNDINNFTGCYEELVDKVLKGKTNVN